MAAWWADTDNHHGCLMQLQFSSHCDFNHHIISTAPRMASTADTVQSSPSTDRPVYELLGQAEEVAAKQIAVFSSTNDGRFARATMGGVVCINQKDFGLTAWDDSDEDSNVGMLSALRNPPSMNRMLGYIDKILDNKWALIRLEARKRLQNIIRVPNSFGGGFVPTKIASIDLRPNCEVWIATGKGVVTGRSNPTPETPWAVELKSGDLGAMIKSCINGFRL